MALSLALQAQLQPLLDCLIPADDFPAAWAAGVGDYLAQQWTGDLARYTTLIEQGVACLDNEAAAATIGATFATLPAAQQVTLLQTLEKGDGQTAWSVSPQLFLNTLTNLAAEGYYGNPANDGNRAAQSWQMIGFREGPPRELGVPPASPAISTATLIDLKKADEYDAIVIGAGAAGGIVACVLAEAGQKVLLIERGRWLPYAAVERDHLRNHRLALYGHNTGPALQGNPRVFVDQAGEEHIVAPHHGGYHNNAMTVGGGTRVYGAQAWRFLPEDFRMASEYGVPAGSSLADWPISLAELAPYYERAEWEIGVAGADQVATPRGPRSRGYPMPPVPSNPKRIVLEQGAAKLGWQTAPMPLLINTIPYQGRPACVQCGLCVGFACPSESKNGTHNTVIPRALATGNCTLLTETQASQIVTDAHGKVTGVDLVAVVNNQEVQRMARARHVIVSAGAIESARLLLNSASAAHPTGLGNHTDQVGRHLQGHIYTNALGLFDQALETCAGPGVSISTCDFNHGNPGLVGGGLLANEFVKLPIYFWRTSLPPGLPRWGAANKLYMRDAYRRTVQVMGPVQEIPTPDMRVTLDPKVKDQFGVPVARLSGVYHPANLPVAEFMRARAEEWLWASGAKQVWSSGNTPHLSAGQHQAGTCRMGTDPQTSVTDPWGRVHGHENLYVVDGSLHVTNGGFNPVLTIMALAFRCAEQIAEH